MNIKLKSGYIFWAELWEVVELNRTEWSEFFSSIRPAQSPCSVKFSTAPFGLQASNLHLVNKYRRSSNFKLLCSVFTSASHICCPGHHEPLTKGSLLATWRLPRNSDYTSELLGGCKSLFHICCSSSVKIYYTRDVFCLFGECLWEIGS